MSFFKIQNLLKSWSFQIAGLVTVAPVVDEFSPFFSWIPVEHKPYVVTLLGAAIMLTRAIKQTKTKFIKE